MNQLGYLLYLSIVFAPICIHSDDSANPTRIQKLLSNFNYQEGIIYKTVGNEQLDMTIFLPRKPTKEKIPVMLYTHGGGWGAGDKYKIFRNASFASLQQILDAGIACAAIEYRLTKVGTSNAIDCVIDCKDAARFLVRDAGDYQLDTDRMGVWGGSAGGHLALMTGLAENQLFEGEPALSEFDPTFKCIVSYYPATTFQKPELLEGSNFQRPQRMLPMIGGLAKDHPDRVALLSPTEHVKKNSPPMMLLHGDRDKVLPIALSEYFVSVANEVQADARLITVKGGEHGFSGDISPGFEEINRMVGDFIISHLQQELSD